MNQSCRRVTIYALICPLTHQCRWVGRTVESLERRISKHLRHGSNNYNPRKQFWLSALREQALKPIGVVLEETDVPSYVPIEVWWIEYFRVLGADLLNVKHPD